MKSIILMRRKFRSSLLGANLLLFLCTLIAFSADSFFSARTESRKFAIDITRMLVAADYREAIIAAERVVPSQFYRLRFVDDGNNVVFDLPVDKPKDLSIDTTIEVPIAVGAEHPVGKLYASFDLLSSMSPLILIAFFWILISIPIHRRLEKRFIREYQRSTEIERQAVIAQTTQMLAHDVRRPFTQLKIALNLINAASGDPDRIAKVCQHISTSLPKATRRIDSMISDVMELGSTAPLSSSKVSVSAVFDEALNEVFPNAIPKEVSVIKNLNTPNVEASYPKVVRAITNLVQNAADAVSDHGGIITLSSTDIGSFVRLSIHNSGPPISSEIRGKLFQAFATFGKPKGTGLGLAIVKKVAEAHRGRAGVESSDIKGTAFFIDLPKKG